VNNFPNAYTTETLHLSVICKKKHSCRLCQRSMPWSEWRSDINFSKRWCIENVSTNDGEKLYHWMLFIKV